MKPDEEGFFYEGDEMEFQLHQNKTIFVENQARRPLKKEIIKIVKPLCIYTNIKLFKYPSEIDRISKYEGNEEEFEHNEDLIPLDKIKQSSDEKEDLCGDFLNKVTCSFFRYRGQFIKRKDPTLFIQNVALLIKN